MTEEEAALARALVPLAKLTTGKQAVSVMSEVIEVFGGAGYVEDTGVAGLMRDAQVFPIWEGTTNVLSLDVLRALTRSKTGDPLAAITREVEAKTGRADTATKEAAETARAAIAHASAWLHETTAKGPVEIERGARRFALTLGRALEVAFLVDEGAWQKESGLPAVASAAARRLAKNGVDQLAQEPESQDSALLAE
jgi:hypothetical protein